MVVSKGLSSVALISQANRQGLAPFILFVELTSSLDGGQFTTSRAAFVSGCCKLSAIILQQRRFRLHIRKIFLVNESDLVLDGIS